LLSYRQRHLLKAEDRKAREAQMQQQFQQQQQTMMLVLGLLRPSPAATPLSSPISQPAPANGQLSELQASGVDVAAETTTTHVVQ
jgi:hypothetical protein